MNAAPCRVMVVDDDHDVRETLSLVLEEEGYAVIAAADGAEALEKLAAADPPPALILLDLMMPVLDGKGFRERQLRDGRLAAIPTYVVSAFDGAEKDAATMNVAGILKKPVRLNDLLALAARHCGCG